MLRKSLSIFISMAIITASAGCATNRKSTLALMGAGLIAGGTVGAVTRPEGEEMLPHALLWGGITAAACGAAGLFLFDEEKAHDETKERAAKLESEIKKFKEELNPKIVSQSTGVFEKPVPAPFDKLIKQGAWKIYKMDRWIAEGEDNNRIIHQDKMIEVTPPQLMPVNHEE